MCQAAKEAQEENLIIFIRGKIAAGISREERDVSTFKTDQVHNLDGIKTARLFAKGVANPDKLHQIVLSHERSVTEIMQLSIQQEASTSAPIKVPGQDRGRIITSGVLVETVGGELGLLNSVA